MRLSVSRFAATTLLTVAILLCLGPVTMVSADRPDMKNVDTVISSYTIDGTTVYFVSHVTGIMRWIVEPSAYMDWENGSIPIDGELRLESCTLQHERWFSTDSRIAVMSSASTFSGTLEVMPTPPGIPGIPPYMPMPKDGVMNTYSVIRKFGELGTSKLHTIVQYRDFVPEILLQKTLPPPTPLGKRLAYLTGNIRDSGVDTDRDSEFDYLVLSVEVAVRTPGFYTVSVQGLMDSSRNTIFVYAANASYLDRGTSFVDVWLSGLQIYLSGLNPSMVTSIELLDENYNLLESKTDVPLSREYSFEEFERPSASLVGLVSDEGIDSDGDGTFDYLRLGVGVQVGAPGSYTVAASGLRDVSYDYVDVQNSNLTFLDVGFQVVNVDLFGPSIYASGFNVSIVTSITLTDEFYNSLGSAFDVPLSREYSYTEFDQPGAHLTGVITDQGVDTDDPADGTFDYLLIGVQVEVSEAGTYTVQSSVLLDAQNQWIDVGGSNSTYLDIGTDVVYLQLDGPTIYQQGLNPSQILSIRLFDDSFHFLGMIQFVALSRTYLYTELDSTP